MLRIEKVHYHTGHTREVKPETPSIESFSVALIVQGSQGTWSQFQRTGAQGGGHPGQNANLITQYKQCKDANLPTTPLVVG